MFDDEENQNKDQEDQNEENQEQETDEESETEDEDEYYSGDEDYQPDEEVEIINPNQNQRQQRQRRPPTWFEDYVMLAEESPITYEDCMKSNDKEEWVKAIKEEKECLRRNNTWDLIDPKEAKGKEIVTSRWLFKIKDSGQFKARLVARGCQQKNELNYKDIYSSVININSLRMLLAIAATENLDMMSFDIKSAFLYGDLQEVIYMQLPKDFETNGKICKLKKAIYGLKQAPQQWFKRLTDFLKSEGLIQLKTDQCVFKSANTKLFVGIHVDDGLAIGNRSEILKLMNKLKLTFETKITENPEMYLGMQIKRTN